MKSKEGLRQTNIKGATKDCFIFDGWVESNMSDESLMDVCADMIGMLKTNTQSFSKNKTKYWTVYSKLILNINLVLPVDRPLNSIGCNYNYQKPLYFFATEGARIKNTIFTIDISNLNSFMMFPIDMLFLYRPCLSTRE